MKKLLSGVKKMMAARRRYLIGQLNHPHMEELMATLFQRVEALEAENATLKAEVAAIQPGSDPTAAIAAAIAPVEEQLNQLSALVGQPSA